MSDGVSVPGQLRAVRVWLYAVAAMIFLTLVVGGATRLTESGLSITEWKPVTGVLPPLTETAWQDEFTKYRAIPQYQQINRGMSLDEFKTIYWWEWSHRLLARSTGAVFLLPFLFFLWRGWIPPALKMRLWLIFAGGAALGAVGWWMVSSGLVGRTSVSQYRLAFHLTLACLIYAAVVWTARRTFGRHVGDVPPLVRRGGVLLMALVLFQIYLGALVAGLRAGLAYNTWPLIDGTIVPDAARLWSETPAWRNLFENVLTVQFNHRMIAYAVWVLAVAHLWSAYALPADRVTRRNALALALLVTVQAILGILTLVHVVPLGLAIVHQGFAVVVLTAAVVHAERLSGGERRSVVSGHATLGQGI
ncbi:MAG: COX15/CtaA family protein [Xanthobacteraceae bacterium]|uniref:COX15/CtaA family protein n=1 Tax=Pseudolabrys sp. TaxID=1960880 RepID=UPI003D0D9ECF